MAEITSTYYERLKSAFSRARNAIRKYVEAWEKMSVSFGRDRPRSYSAKHITVNITMSRKACE